MKSKSTLLSLLLVFIAAHLSAAPMRGIFTIGGTTPDFTTIQTAMDTLLARGVDSAVIFNIRPGTYDGQIHVNNIPGTSATNTITIQSENNDSTSVILTDTASQSTGNFVFHVYGADYLTLKHVTLHRIGNIATCSVINLATNSRYFRLIGCILMNDNPSGTNESQALIFWPSGGATDSLVVFDGNQFLGGSYAIYMTGQNPNASFYMPQFTNNHFINQNYGGIYVDYCRNAVFNNNIISTTSTSFGFSGVYIRGNSGGVDISGNKFSGIQNGYGIQLDSVNGTIGTPGRISNNFIQTLGTGSYYALYLNDIDNVNIDFNSINNTSTSTNSAGIYVETSSSSNLQFRNNNLVATGGGVTFFVSGNDSTAITSCDYNNLFIGGSSLALAYFLTDFDTTLADWQAASGFDANSVSVDPLFISSSDLHAGSPVVNNVGTPLATVTTDIDGEIRSLTTPDIGADEFTPLSDNLSALSFILPVNSSCGDSATVVTMVVKNFGQNAQTGFDVNAQLSGMLTITLTETYSGTLASNAVDTITFTTTVNTYAGGTLNITAYTSLAGDQDNNNDTIARSFTFLSHPNAPNVPSPQTVCDNGVSITGTPDSAHVLVWYSQPVGGNILHVGNTFHPILQTDTTFYVESRTGSTNPVCLRITEIQPQDFPTGDFMEITNISGVPFNDTGWVALISNNYNDINQYLPFVWNIGYMGPDAVSFKTDAAGDTNFIGDNILWDNSNPGWAMIVDNQNNVVDFVVWDWDTTEINNMAVPYNGDTLRPGTIWSGQDLVTCGAGTSTSDLQRFGSSDNDDATDWACTPVSPGTFNVNMTSPFNGCGIGSCGSPRVSVDVLLTPGITPVNLGPDTIVGNNDSLLLDAGAGYDTYIWSTGDTTQSIYAGQGMFWVMVVGGPNNCTYSDTIMINIPVAITPVFGKDDMRLYPNPAKDKLYVTVSKDIRENSIFRITDMEGRILHVQPSNGNGELIFDLNGLANGMYYLQVINGNKSGAGKFTLIR